MTILAIFAMVGFVACQKPTNDNKKDEQKEEQKPDDQNPEEYAGPVEGTSEWSLTGQLLDANWDKDYVAAKDGDIYVVKNVKLAASDQFKFRKDKAR